MGVLSENTSNNEIETDEEIGTDTFLQDEYLMLNHGLKDKIRDLLNDNKLKLEPKELKTLLETLEESYDFDYRLKQRIYVKKWEYEKRRLFKKLNTTTTYDLEDSWDYDLKDKKDY